MLGYIFQHYTLTALLHANEEGYRIQMLWQDLFLQVCNSVNSCTGVVIELAVTILAQPLTEAAYDEIYSDAVDSEKKKGTDTEFNDLMTMF